MGKKSANIVGFRRIKDKFELLMHTTDRGFVVAKVTGDDDLEKALSGVTKILTEHVNLTVLAKYFNI